MRFENYRNSLALHHRLKDGREVIAELAAIPQSRRHPIDRQVDHPPHTLVALAAAVPLQHFDLQMIERAM